MSSTEEDDEHSSMIKTPGQLITVVVAAFVFPVVILLMLGRLAAVGLASDEDNPAYSDAAITARLKPVGTFRLASDTPKPGEETATAVQGASAAVASAPPAAEVSGPDKAKAIYTASCAACHVSGAAGAPKLGDIAAWAPRIKAGNRSLYDSAIKGKNAMPPRGGNASLSDDDVKAAVDYMVGQSK